MILSQYCKEVFGCKVASGVATPWPQWHSNFIGASSFLCLRHAAAMAAAMVASVPCESHPPPGRRMGLSPGCRGGCFRGEPPPPLRGDGLAASVAARAAKRSSCAKRQKLFLHD